MGTLKDIKLGLETQGTDTQLFSNKIKYSQSVFTYFSVYSQRNRQILMANDIKFWKGTYLDSRLRPSKGGRAGMTARETGNDKHSTSISTINLLIYRRLNFVQLL